MQHWPSGCRGLFGTQDRTLMCLSPVGVYMYCIYLSQFMSEGCCVLGGVTDKFHGAQLQLGGLCLSGCCLAAVQCPSAACFPPVCHVPGIFHWQIPVRQERAAALHCRCTVVE